MTQQQMMREIRALGLTVSVREGEIRVAPKGAVPAAGYYTNDRQDAVNTAKNMAAPPMVVYRTKSGLLGIDNVEMAGDKYDFRFNTGTRQMTFRASDHLGGTFEPISDTARYANHVRLVVRAVGLAFFVNTPKNEESADV